MNFTSLLGIATWLTLSWTKFEDTKRKMEITRGWGEGGEIRLRNRHATAVDAATASVAATVAAVAGLRSRIPSEKSLSRRCGGPNAIPWLASSPWYKASNDGPSSSGAPAWCPVWWTASDRSHRQIVSPPRTRSADACPRSTGPNNVGRSVSNDTRELILKHRGGYPRRYNASIQPEKYASIHKILPRREIRGRWSNRD